MEKKNQNDLLVHDYFVTFLFLTPKNECIILESHICDYKLFS